MADPSAGFFPVRERRRCPSTRSTRAGRCVRGTARSSAASPAGGAGCGPARSLSRGRLRPGGPHPAGHLAVRRTGLRRPRARRPRRPDAARRAGGPPPLIGFSGFADGSQRPERCWRRWPSVGVLAPRRRASRGSTSPAADDHAPRTATCRRGRRGDRAPRRGGKAPDRRVRPAGWTLLARVGVGEADRGARRGGLIGAGPLGPGRFRAAEGEGGAAVGGGEGDELDDQPELPQARLGQA
jgi:hypothetical protein